MEKNGNELFKMYLYIKKKKSIKQKCTMCHRYCKDDLQFTSAETAQAVPLAPQFLFPVSKAKKFQPYQTTGRFGLRSGTVGRSVNFLWAVAD